MLHVVGADAHQANAYNPLQSENSGYSDAGQAQPGLPEREQSSETVLADILGGWGGLGGTPSKSGRPAATSAGTNFVLHILLKAPPIVEPNAQWRWSK